MSKFDDREQAFEKKFAHDEKMNFRIEARCSKLFGLWIAEKLGLSGKEADAYASEVVAVNLEEPGFNDILKKIGADLKAKNVTISDHMLRVQLEKTHEEAKKQILSETDF